MLVSRTALASFAAFVLAAGFTAAPTCAADPARAADPVVAKLDAAAQAGAATTWREYLEMLAIPDDAVVPADIQKNAAWMVAAFAKAGFTAQLLPNGDVPMVYAAWPDPKPDRPTVLFYMHMDGQPVVNAQWHQASPWQPVLKARDASGAWQPLPTERLIAGPVDPEWRVFARASADDKGPIAMFLAAARAMHATGTEPAVNVKVILDSQEEKNSPTLAGVLERNAALLKSDALIIADGPQHQSNRPTLVFGNRGVVTATLTVYGMTHGAHSGHYGNFIPNPAQRLAKLIGSMKDDDGRVVIPGYYDGIALDAKTKAQLATVPTDETALEKEFGFAAPDRGVGATLQQAIQYPSLNVRGMAAGSVGEKAANVIPDTAIAELDLRTVPESDPKRLLGLVSGWVAKQGYTVLDRAPTPAERLRYPRLASFVAGSASAAVRSDLDSPVGRWTQSALTRAVGTPIVIRSSGATVPTGEMVAQLKIPFVIVPIVNADDNQHTFDENLRLGNFTTGMETFFGLWTQPFVR